MDYEKAYKDALERAINLHKDAIDMNENIRAKQCEIIFPELKESEDEKIRKALIFYLGNMPEDTELRNGVTNRDVFAWLEKQGEQKSNWSEEDDKKQQSLIKGLEDKMGFGWASDPFSREEYIDWLKSLKQRIRG